MCVHQQIKCRDNIDAIRYSSTDFVNNLMYKVRCTNMCIRPDPGGLFGSDEPHFLAI